MLKGSNNSLTYLEPLNWWFKIIKFIGRHQSIQYDEQYIFGGCRFFDIKLFVNEHNKIVVRNGSFTYMPFSLYEIMDFFNKQGDVLVHITFEVTAQDYMNISYNAKETKFLEYCKILEMIYPNIMFCGGKRKFDNKCLHTFEYEQKNGSPNIFNIEEQSFLYKVISRISPRLTRILNKRYIKQYGKIHDILLLNHIW